MSIKKANVYVVQQINNNIKAMLCCEIEPKTTPCKAFYFLGRSKGG